MNKDKDFQEAVDRFYGELEDESIKSWSNEDNKDELIEELSNMKIIMDKAEDNYVEDINFLSIIDKGERIREEEKDKKENLYFLLSAFGAISFIFSLAFFAGHKAFITIQVIITICVVGFSIYSYKRVEEGRD